MKNISIFDTTLRDGEQSAGVNLNQLEKLQIARQLEKFGVNVLEAGFPSSSKGDFLSVQEISNTLKNVSVTGLARSIKGDIDISWEALKGGVEPRLHVFIATSPIHMKYKLRKTPDQVMQLAVDMVTYARTKFPKVQWSAEDASRSDFDFLAKIITKVIEAGATVINLPDTVGFATPEEYGAMFRYIVEHVPNIHKATLSAHCHNDLGLAVANSLAGIQNGVTQIEGTINGIGERAGNVSLEELAVILELRSEIYYAKTSLVLNEIKRTSDLVSRLSGMLVASNKAIVGRNAFAHESGIHQDGILKNPATYEIISPQLVGVAESSLVVGKHSGRHAFSEKIKDMGFNFTDENLQKAFTTFKQLTDHKKEITDDDLFAILMDIETGFFDIKNYELIEFQVQTGGQKHFSTATVAMLSPDGEKKEKPALGSGSLEALFNAFEKIVDEPISLKNFQLNSIGKGRDALADVRVEMVVDGKLINGRGFAQDVLEASMTAFVNTVNRFLYQKNAVKKREVIKGELE